MLQIPSNTSDFRWAKAFDESSVEEEQHGEDSYSSFFLTADSTTQSPTQFKSMSLERRSTYKRKISSFG
jgi:hypothetical protein